MANATTNSRLVGSQITICKGQEDIVPSYIIFHCEAVIGNPGSTALPAALHGRTERLNRYLASICDWPQQSALESFWLHCFARVVHVTSRKSLLSLVLMTLACHAVAKSSYFHKQNRRARLCSGYMSMPLR